MLALSNLKIRSKFIKKMFFCVLNDKPYFFWKFVAFGVNLDYEYEKLLIIDLIFKLKKRNAGKKP